MSNSKSPIDVWLTGLDPAVDQDQAFWDPGFDSERRWLFPNWDPIKNCLNGPSNLHRAFTIAFIPC